jgi:2,3,4,5-tetrahydropyridine-2-carboxylate N-succinyltransferase
MNINKISSITFYQKGTVLKKISRTDPTFKELKDTGKLGKIISLSNGENELIPGQELSDLDSLIKFDKNAYSYLVFEHEIDNKIIESSNAFFEMSISNKNIDLNTFKKEKINNMTLYELFKKIIALLESGTVRAVNFIDGKYLVNEWVKKALLLGFKIGVPKISEGFCDKDTFPLRKITKDMQVRVVPPASGIRSGAYVGKNCVLMPPAYVNTGAYIGANTIIENLAGSCSQVGRHCHISAGAIIGGVLDPVEASPVIIGDYSLLGEGTGITQGVRLGHMVTLAPGVHISKATPVIDPYNSLAYTSRGSYSIKQTELSNQKIKIYELDKLIKEKENSYGPEVPDGALVIPGIMISSNGLLKQTPVIAKYIKSPEERAYALEETLRN